jgi:hypothetical protein
MRMIIVSCLLSLFIFSTAFADGLTKVYDSQYNLKGYVQDGKVYDTSWKHKYTIKDDNLYDTTYNKIGRVDRSNHGGRKHK